MLGISLDISKNAKRSLFLLTLYMLMHMYIVHKYIYNALIEISYIYTNIAVQFQMYI